MSGFPRVTAERPPSLLEGDTKIELSPMARGAEGVKRFFESKSKEKKGDKKVTKKDAAATLGFADGTIKNMLTAGKLKGDGKGGVTDESVAAFQNKKIKKETDEQRGEIESAGGGADGVEQGTNQNKHVDDADRGQQSGYYAQAEDKNGNSTDAPTNDRENSRDVEASDFFDEHVRHPVETDGKEVQIVHREIPEWLATLAKKIYKAGLEHGREDRDMVYAAGYKAAVREAESIDLDSLYMDVFSGMEVAR